MSRLEIAVFARAPEPGSAKTRLIPHLGAQAAARLQSALTSRALQRACAVPDAVVTLWVTGATEHPDIVACHEKFGVEVRTQVGLDLGARMQAAIEHGWTQGRATIVIGTDCPAQSTADLIAACDALQTCDVVLQPAHDGGYVLIGAKASPMSLTTIFAGVEWGTDRVLAATRARLRRSNVNVAELRALPDLDRPEDLAVAIANGWMSREEFA